MSKLLFLQTRGRSDTEVDEVDAEQGEGVPDQPAEQSDNGVQQSSEGERMATEAHGDVDGAEVSIGDGDYQVVGIIFIIVC